MKYDFQETHNKPKLYHDSFSNSNNKHVKNPLKDHTKQLRRKDFEINECEKRKPWINSTPSKKSVNKVIFLLLCLVFAFGIQNVIFSNLKNTSVIKSPTQVFATNLIMCLIIFAILLVINKQPKQTYYGSTTQSYRSGSNGHRRSSLLENNKWKPCVESRLFCTSLFCCCYCCFNFSDEEDTHRSSKREIAHNFRKSFLIPIAPWIHAMAIFLNVR